MTDTNTPVRAAVSIASEIGKQLQDLTVWEHILERDPDQGQALAEATKITEQLAELYASLGYALADAGIQTVFPSRID